MGDIAVTMSPIIYNSSDIIRLPEQAKLLQLQPQTQE